MAMIERIAESAKLQLLNKLLATYRDNLTTGPFDCYVSCLVDAADMILDDLKHNQGVISEESGASGGETDKEMAV